MSKRDLALSGFGISAFRYRELSYFCLQYPEKRRAVRELYGLTPPEMTGLPKRGGVSRPTEGRALKIARLTRDCELIDQTAKEIDPYIAPALVANVTTGITYEQMRARGREIPCGRRQFYERRQRFFRLLDQKLGNTDPTLSL